MVLACQLSLLITSHHLHFVQNSVASAKEKAVKYLSDNSDGLDGNLHGLALTAYALQKAGKPIEAKKLYQTLRTAANVNGECP